LHRIITNLSALHPLLFAESHPADAAQYLLKQQENGTIYSVKVKHTWDVPFVDIAFVSNGVNNERRASRMFYNVEFVIEQWKCACLLHHPAYLWLASEDDSIERELKEFSE